MTLDWDINKLRETQRERMAVKKLLFVPSWDMNVPIKKLTAGQIIEAGELSTSYNPETNKWEQNSEKKNIWLLLFAIDGVERKHKEFLEADEGGVINSLLAKVLEFSGFGSDIQEVGLEGEKKS